jgi:hypothetical protein
MRKQKLHEVLGLSVEETLNRLIRVGQIAHQYKQDHGEKLDMRYLLAVLHANSPPKEEKTT